MLYFRIYVGDTDIEGFSQFLLYSRSDSFFIFLFNTSQES